MRIAATGLLLLILTCGCATTKVETGTDIKEPAKVIKAGTTTREEVIKAFGQPSKVSSKDGGEELVYEYQTVATPTFIGGIIINEAGQSITLKRLEIVIQDNVVQSYRFEAREK